MQDSIKPYWIKFFHSLNETQKRIAAALEAMKLGYGGISQISNITGLSRNTIARGLDEIKNNKEIESENNKIRAEGGGRKSICENNNKIKEEIENILNDTTAGDPMSKLKWTYKSVRSMEKELKLKGHDISYKTINRILNEMEYSLQSNRKSLSREDNPNRDDQFKKINSIVKLFIKNGQPVISVDTKKKELIGKFKNSGKTWRKKNDPIIVEDHDFKSRGKGLAVP